MGSDKKTVESQLSPESIQAKADILETNLFSAVSKQDDASKALIIISREEYPDSVIQKTIEQLLPRYNISDVKISRAIGKLLLNEISGDKPEMLQFDVHNVNNPLQKSRKIEVEVTDKQLKIIISGVEVKNSKNGKIAKYFFNYKDYPGKLLKNNKIDFREINKFPSIKGGDNLFLVSHEEIGTPGISFDGVEIPIAGAKPLDLKLNDGVERIEQYDDRGGVYGYMVRSRKTGVVVLNKSESSMDVDVKDEIEVGQLDYSTGNIGTEFICPIRMKVGVVCGGFKISVKGRIDIEVLDGGTIRTDDEAVVDKIQSKSSITAKHSVSFNTSIHSTITSIQGRVSIEQELIDSKVDAPVVHFDAHKGLLTNSSIETEEFITKNIVISGDNNLLLGTSLFSRKEKLLDEIETIGTKKLDFSNVEKEAKQKLIKQLKGISSHAKEDKSLFPKFKLLLQMLQTMSFEHLDKVLDSLQQNIDGKTVFIIRKLFNALEKSSTGILELEKKAGKIQEEINSIDHRLNKMTFSIEGRLRPTGTIAVFVQPGPADQESEPALLIKSDQKVDKTIKVIGTHTNIGGFKYTAS